ncbi:proton-conducting transporter membrane subunit [Acidithiobacillus sp. IBUN Pt1247-S3]|uniref:proton-conducting transporter transmembrane domain-containing protein n=1 Tax=Acidithiobacillus sp. IBUN Pt1247-S3 TaxID=3166642 RepID=UPI0034E5D2FB
MSTNLLTTITGSILCTLPILYIAAALPKALPGVVSAQGYRARIQLISIIGFLLALLAVVGFALGARGDFVLYALPLPATSAHLDVSVQLNAMTMLLAPLVSFVLMILARYSVEYLDGDRAQARFFQLLALTGGFFLLVTISGNLGLFTLAIIATGFSLHRLLDFYDDRRKAIMAAHKKSLFSRAADLCLVITSGLVASGAGTLEFSKISVLAQAGPFPWQLQLAAWFLVFAVILKSAQFPFHGWLIQVMEAPTPVSALMHAGVVYSGAIVAMRMSPLLLRQESALLFLGAVGLMTLVLASLTMITQTAIKSSLAWSTVAQLGFMLLELGLGLFYLALLHLLGHSLYKAHAFLSSSSGVDHLRQLKPTASAGNFASWLLGTVLGLAASLGLSFALGLQPLNQPVTLALAVIVGIAMSQIFIKGSLFASWTSRSTAAVLAVLMMAVYYLLHILFHGVFAADFAHGASTSPAYQIFAAFVMLSFLFLSWIQGPGRTQLPISWQRSMYVALYNGLYVDLWIERIAYRLWPEKFAVQKQGPSMEFDSLDSSESYETVARGGR